MLVSEKDYLSLHKNRDSPIQEAMRFFPRIANQKLFKNRAISFWCDARDCFMSLFICVLHCPENQEAENCTIIPESLREYILPLKEIWYDTLVKLEKGINPMPKKMILKKKAIATSKKDDTLVSYKENKPVSNGDFQDLFKGFSDLLDSKLISLKHNSESQNGTLRLFDERLTSLIKVVSGMKETLNALVESIKGQKSIAAKKEKETGETGNGPGRKPAGVMSVKDALLKIVAENGFEEETDEEGNVTLPLDGVDLQELYKLVDEITEHKQQSGQVKKTMISLDLLSP